MESRINLLPSSSHTHGFVREDRTEIPKKHYSFIKSKQCEASGVATLSNRVNRSDNKTKYNILSDQITSDTISDTMSVPKLDAANRQIVRPFCDEQKNMS